MLSAVGTCPRGAPDGKVLRTSVLDGDAQLYVEGMEVASARRQIAATALRVGVEAANCHFPNPNLGDASAFLRPQCARCEAGGEKIFPSAASQHRKAVHGPLGSRRREGKSPRTQSRGTSPCRYACEGPLMRWPSIRVSVKPLRPNR